MDDAKQLGAASAALSKAGYQLGSEVRQLSLEGMSCAGCVRRAENALLNVPGVISAEVDLASHQARVVFIAGMPTDVMFSALKTAGYPGRWVNLEGPAEQDLQVPRG